MESGSDFINKSTVSAIAEVLFYNEVTSSFVFVALHAERKPSGLVKYSFEFHRPIGLIQDETQHIILVTFEYIEIFLLTLYVLNELYTFGRIFQLYFKTKKMKVEMQARASS